MVKTKVMIVDFEDKTSRDGNRHYSRFKCKYDNNSTKWMSAFDKDLIEKLKSKRNEWVEIDVVENNNFFNINKIFDDDKSADFGKDIMKQSQASMYVSYAKDIFIELIKHPKIEVKAKVIEKAMGHAVNLVKQAYDSFK